MRFPCIFKIVFHLYCPVCGGTRAAIAFVRLHFIESFLDHPIVLYCAFVALWLLVGVIGKRLRWKNADFFHFQMWMVWTGLILFFGFWVIRNVALVVFHYDYLGDIIG